MAQASTKTPKLTPKEIAFLKGVVSGKTKTQAAMDAYDTTSEKSASVIAAQNLGKLRIKEALEDAYDKAGITAQSIADVLSDAMLATKTATVAGEVIPSTQPDHSVRVTAARTAAQLLGAGKGDDDPTGGPTFNFQTNNYIKQVDVRP